jgi:hypothetical protein
MAGSYRGEVNLRELVLMLRPLRKSGYYITHGMTEVPFTYLERNCFHHVEAETIIIVYSDLFPI